MKVLVTYFTRSGNTEKVAKAIYEELKEPKSIEKINNNLKLDEYGLVFLGYPIENYWCPKDIHDFLRKNTENANIVFFITHGVPENNPLLPKWIDRTEKLLHPTSKIIDRFTCQSEVAQYVVDALKQSGKPMQMQWADHCHLLKGLPDENKLEKAREFARAVRNKIE
jgi:flavodoxin